MAPTTLTGQKTLTTPSGRDPKTAGYPIKISKALVQLDGTAYIERVAVNNPKNIMQAKKAIKKEVQWQTGQAPSQKKARADAKASIKKAGGKAKKVAKKVAGSQAVKTQLGTSDKQKAARKQLKATTSKKVKDIKSSKKTQKGKDIAREFFTGAKPGENISWAKVGISAAVAGTMVLLVKNA